ncbi:MAG: bacillithiol biosynthesis cysteine-adding enzyme BshC [Bacteroidota bacterium]
MKTPKADLKSDYLSGAEALRPFYQYAFPPSDYAGILRDKASDPMDRATLADELLRQNRELPDAAATLANIEQLRDNRTFTVTTGHQLVMLGGPMYTLYKIASTIRLAEIIQQKHPEYPVVPVFWMATEDHDWAEINHFHSSFTQRRTYRGSFRGAVGRHLLEPSIESVLPADLDAALKACFVPGRKYAEAFRAFIHQLFGATGLVIVDADTPVLKRLFLPAMRRELSATGMFAHIDATNQRLEALGYKQQIFPRPVNLFYLGNGDRELIERTAEGDFHLKGSDTVISATDLQARLEAHPEDFSPNVACRPLYQETILPNLAYVGGWAETSYWMQLREAFEAAGINFPLLVPRMHATLLTPTQAEEANRLEIPPADLGRSLHDLHEAHLDRHWTDAELQEHFGEIHTAYQHLAEHIQAIDPTLAISVRANWARTAKKFHRLKKKVRKSLRNQQPKPYEAISLLKNAVSPEHRQQQRVLNFTAFSDFTAVELVAVILEHCHPDQYADQWIILP